MGRRRCRRIPVLLCQVSGAPPILLLRVDPVCSVASCRLSRVPPAAGEEPCLLANILPNIRHILGISLLPLFYPYGRYLALFYIYGLDLTLAYTRHSQSSVFIAEEL